MSVLLVFAETAAGAEVSDALSGGSTGLDLGQVVNGSYSPVTLQSANTGQQECFISHNATVDPITNVVTYVDTYTGTYGGANSAAADYTTLKAYGAADSGGTNNNSDGNSRGLAIDMDWQVSSVNQFAYSRETTGQKRIFGKTYSGPKDGTTEALGFDMHIDAMSYWNGSTEVDATTPVTGKIGKTSDTILGNRAHFKKRFFLNLGAIEGGILQYDFVIAYSYTA